MLLVRLTSRVSSSAAFGLALVVLATGAGSPLSGQSLRGSPSSLDRQNRVARQHDFTYIETPDRVRFFATQGWLVPIKSSGDFIVKKDVSFPYARPEVQLFARRLGSQYRSACGERLVVTSLTRPTNRQPRNASDRTVHPTGMALDLRYSWDSGCRRWLEGVLTSLEQQGVLEATLERSPRHYHIAIFPDQYSAYVERLVARGITTPETTEYTVRPGDSLWDIARSNGTTVDELKQANGIDGSRIYAGQVLDVPLHSP
jgi:hypothetical protein